MASLLLVGAAVVANAAALTPPGPPLPRQSALQREVVTATQTNATAVSRDAHAGLVELWSTPAILAEIRGVCPSLRNASAAEVVERFYDELAVAEITHNFAWAEAGNHFNDVSLYSLANASYFYNLWELQALGFRPSAQGQSVENEAEIIAMKYPPFAHNSTTPNDYAEAAERPVYGVINLLHVDMGNTDFGHVTVVFNRSYVDRLAIVAPADTGDYFFHCRRNVTNLHCGFPYGVNCTQWKHGLQMGALADPRTMMDHIILANDQMFSDIPFCPSSRQPRNVVRNFQRICYEEHAPADRPKFDLELGNVTMLSFMEADLAGAISLTQGVKFVVAQATTPGLFGTGNGTTLRSLAIKWGRVLVWALGVPSIDDTPVFVATDTRVVDPVVLAAIPAGSNVSAAALAETGQAFAAAWEAAASAPVTPAGWASLVAHSSDDLVVRSLRARDCNEHDQCVGVSRNGDCVCYDEE